MIRHPVHGTSPGTGQNRASELREDMQEGRLCRGKPLNILIDQIKNGVVSPRPELNAIGGFSENYQTCVYFSAEYADGKGVNRIDPPFLKSNLPAVFTFPKDQFKLQNPTAEPVTYCPLWLASNPNVALIASDEFERDTILGKMRDDPLYFMENEYLREIESPAKFTHESEWFVRSPKVRMGQGELDVFIGKNFACREDEQYDRCMERVIDLLDHELDALNEPDITSVRVFDCGTNAPGYGLCRVHTLLYPYDSWRRTSVGKREKKPRKEHKRAPVHAEGQKGHNTTG